MGRRPGTVYTLIELSEWLHYEAWCQGTESQTSNKGLKQEQQPNRKREGKPPACSTTQS